MLKALPATALLIVVIATTGFLVWTMYVGVRERNLRKVRKAAKWSHFSRPNRDGNWEIGVHRVTSDERVLDEFVMVHLPGDVSDSERIDAEGKAMIRAGQFNEATL
jgi:hypothetical protein